MIVPPTDLGLFSLAALAMVLTPGPNMIYLVSRSLCQGTRAAEVSLGGVALGFVSHMLIAACGLTAFFLAVPYAYTGLKYLGCAYLLWLAFKAIRSSAGGLFQRRVLAADSPGKLLWMGFLTNALNPKIAVFYVSIFSQFLDPARGSVLVQSLILGLTQIVISVTVNFTLIHFAGFVATWFEEKPAWAKFQRWGMAGALTGLAVKLAVSERK